MSQLNLKTTATFTNPPTGSSGYGFDSNGHPVRINSDGSTTRLAIEDDEGSGVVPNIITNRGIGLEVDLPTVNDIGDIYVTNDTYKVYTAVDSESWSSKDLIKSQFITDSVTLYQFDGTTLIIMGDEKDFVDFVPQATPPGHQEGRAYYDAVKHALTYYNETLGVDINLGSEVGFRVYNGNAFTINNGEIVAPDSINGVTLADNRFTDKSRSVAVATHDVPPGTFGRFMVLGSVGGLDTSAYGPMQPLYLGENGLFSPDYPSGGRYLVVVAYVNVVSATDGVILVDMTSSNLAVEVTDTNGFPTDQREGSTLSFVDGTRTFTIEPTATDYHFYQHGNKFEKTGSDDIIISDVTGAHFIYFNEETLTSVAKPTFAQIREIILSRAFVAYIYYNSTNSRAELFVDERHGISMSPATHAYLHITRGAQYVEGLAPDGYIVGGNGSLDSHAQFGVLSGIIVDEDLTHTLNTITSTIGMRYYYRLGASGIWEYDTTSGFNFPVGATPLPQYNEYTGATWQLTEVVSGDFMLLHLFATGTMNQDPICFLGIDSYGSSALATDGASTEIDQLLGNLPGPEFVPIATFVLEGKSSLTNSVHARFVLTGAGEDYLDWRETELAQGGGSVNHNNLSGLQLAADSVTWGHINDQAQTIAGLKTFTDGIVDGLQKDGIESITGNPASQKITFSGDSFADINYRLLMQAYDSYGIAVFVTRVSKEIDGFNVIIEQDCTLEYNAKKL